MLTSRPFSCYMNYVCNQHQFTLSKYKQILSILSNSASWRRLMRVPWTSRRSNQSILKEISPEYSLEGLTLKLTLSPVLWPPDAKKNDLLKKTLMLGKVEGRRRREGDNREWDACMASPTQWTWAWASSGRWWWTGKPGVLQSMGLQRVGHDWASEMTDTQQILVFGIILFL